MVDTFRHPIDVTQPADDRAAIRVVYSAEQMLPPEVVEEIYAAAAAQPPLSEPPSVAKMFADLYRHSRTEAGAVMTIATVAAAPVGFAYGHDWSWDTAIDPWSTELRDRLGEQAAQRIATWFAVELLAVTPTASGAGVGRQLLSSLLEAATSSAAWLQTADIDSPARRLYLATGWRTLGSGPDAPNGKPGLVMINQTHTRTNGQPPMGPEFPTNADDADHRDCGQGMSHEQNAR